MILTGLIVEGREERKRWIVGALLLHLYPEMD
jgi:hypothetical protein